MSDEWNVPEWATEHGKEVSRLRDQLAKADREREEATAANIELNRFLRRIDAEITDGEQGPNESLAKASMVIEEWNRSNPGAPPHRTDDPEIIKKMMAGSNS